MAESSVRIVYSAVDAMSDNLRSMRNGTNILSRDVNEYRRISDNAFSRRTNIRIETNDARRELTSLQNEFKSLSRQTDLSADDLEREQTRIVSSLNEQTRQVERLQLEYGDLTRIVREARREENRMLEDRSRADNDNDVGDSGLRGGDIGGSSQGLMKSLAVAGIGNMFSESISGFANQTIGSAFGETAGEAISSVVGSAITGAAMGSIIPGIGTAIGAGLGAISGAISAATIYAQKDDEIFKNYVNETYDSIKSTTDESLRTGSGLAAQREMDNISFRTLLGGEEESELFLNQAQDFAKSTPYEMNDILTTSKTLLTYKFDKDEIFDLMGNIGDASSALGINTEGQKWVATALGRMNATDKASLEYINMLEERAIPAVDYLAVEYGKSNAEIRDMISKKSISGIEAAEIISEAMGEQFSGNMELQAKTFSGLGSTLDDVNAQLDMAMGSGYNEVRKQSIQEDISFYDGNEELQEGYRLIGEFKADVKNSYDESLRVSRQSVLDSSEYKLALDTGDGVRAGEMLWEAQSRANIDWKNSDQYKLMQESEINLVTQIQQSVDIKESYFELGKSFAQQVSKGYSSVLMNNYNGGMYNANGPYGPYVNINSENTSEPSETSNDAVTTSYYYDYILNNKVRENVIADSTDGKSAFSDDYNDQSKFTLKGKSTVFDDYNDKFQFTLNGTGSSTGLSYVPFDDYKTNLHEGERVLTKAENERYNNTKTSSGNSFNIVVNNYSNDIYDITEQIVDRLSSAISDYGG